MRRSLMVIILASCLAATTFAVDATQAGKPAQPNAGASQPVEPGSLAGRQYARLVIRNAMLINGRGTPTEGPVDIVIERDTIADIIPTDGVSMRGYGPAWKRPEGDRVIDATGLYVIPGLVDMHTHVPGTRRGGADQSAYAYKLWLAHGVTTLRDASTTTASPTPRFPGRSPSRPTTTTGTRSIASAGRGSCGRKPRSIPSTSRRSSTR